MKKFPENLGTYLEKGDDSDDDNFGRDMQLFSKATVPASALKG